MNKAVLVQLIDLLDRFEAENPAGMTYNLKDFVGYLNAQSGFGQSAMREISGQNNAELENVRIENNSDISIFITLMFRYAKSYIKKALQNSIIQTADEFAFLITLISSGSLTKTELINQHIMEKTSGIEVIKRLLSQGMIQEFADETDKRSVRVAVTDKGKMEFFRVLPEMGKVSKLVVGNLSETEINTLGFLLKKLDLFHNDIYKNMRSATLEEILNQSAAVQQPS
ncbi:transcriptional regulator, MarR family [Mariniradius saccharolyticus AK6]|uniref:Transcriptional regulator, MarR family n=1 Tax=Mariniradius saccharolyticus AK6 TaxID=1239962 RepID=M7XFL8_9BACT|nr:MarR family winged helix-turn-helix transcriptional regulator [Mariniradius saccharolyticus]EMS33659.1 transcriptional regulator, MarR family [Mariniradius saccharolyticus AK6]